MEINICYAAEALTECAVIKADLFFFGDNLFLVRQRIKQKTKNIHNS